MCVELHDASRWSLEAQLEIACVIGLDGMALGVCKQKEKPRHISAPGLRGERITDYRREFQRDRGYDARS